MADWRLRLFQQPLLPAGHRPRRMVQLLAGLVLYGVTDAMVLASGLGVEPWDALAQGLSRTAGLSVGLWTNLIGALVLLLWIPLRQKPGLGTVCNILIVGTSMDLALIVLPVPGSAAESWTLLLAGTALNGLATGCYIGADAGTGPRDGLMTGIAALGHPLWAVRLAIELTVLAAGFLLGATVGVGTVIYALAIGPLAHLLIPLFQIRPAPGPRGDGVG
ncbi:YitT family protein, partial [Streptosporangium algeriense]